MRRAAALTALARLGPQAVARVAFYRIGLRLGIHPVQRISAAAARAPFFAPPAPQSDLPPSNDLWTDQLRWFDWFTLERPDGPPDWHFNPFGGGRGNQTQEWWRIPDFGDAGDVKGIWELSRFGWLIAFATQAAHGDAVALERMNTWLVSWAKGNPPYRGVNWKCGQEASIRVIHLLTAALVLDQDRRPEPGLVEIVTTHLKRIAPTISYAIGQNNNHGTSEAAAMFVGGSFLAALGAPAGRRWARIGRRWLENRARRLIAADGSFSQYSIVYHRLMLDTYSFAEAWRRRHGLPAFSAALHRRLAAATRWLDVMVDRHSGDAPNLGANDGARILPLTETDYRDFRPSLQTASALFCNRRAIVQRGRWDDQPQWLRITPAEGDSLGRASESFDDGGFHVLRVGEAVACLRYPRFRFRPSQADLLHVDLWSGRRNVLRDGGTFSYNATPEVSDYFAGTASHSTIQFDGRDQMPRLGRFLFGAWPKAAGVVFEADLEQARCAAAYIDYRGARHHREIALAEGRFVCTDTILGRFDAAVLRWRLAPGEYRLEGDCLFGPAGLRLAIDCSIECKIGLTAGQESRYYLQQESIPVLEIIVRGPCRIVTRGEF